MKAILKYFRAYMTHLEELANNKVQEKCAQIKGFLNKWEYAKYLMYLAIYLDVLAILVQMSFSEQKEEHDPVKAV